MLFVSVVFLTVSGIGANWVAATLPPWPEATTTG